MEKDRHLILLGQRIREIRESYGYTQDQMALKAGFARSYYSGVERGVRNISARNLIRLGFAMDVEIGKLFPRLEELE